MAAWRLWGRLQWTFGNWFRRQNNARTCEGRRGSFLLGITACGGVRRCEVGEHMRSEQLARGVVAEERGEQDGHGRQLSDLRGRRRRDAVGFEPGRECVGQARRKAEDHEREEDPDRQHRGARAGGCS